MRKLRYLLFPLLLALTFYIILRESSLAQIRQCLSACRPGWLLIAISCMLLFVLCEAINLRQCLQLTDAAADTGPGSTDSCPDRIDVRFGRQALPYALTGFFFSGITPFASGGQPMQLYAMHRDGIRAAHGTAALAMELASFQAAAVVLAGLGLLRFHGFILQTSGFAVSFLLMGFAANLGLLSLLLLAIFAPGSIPRIAGALAALLQKLRFPKAARFQSAANDWATDYQACAAALRRAPKHTARLLAVSLLQLAAMHSVPYWVALSLGVHGVTLLQMLSLQAVLFLVVSLIPLPGGTGVSEGGFLLLYAAVFHSSSLETAMLLSRFASFYLPLLFSGLLLGMRALHAPANKKPAP